VVRIEINNFQSIAHEVIEVDGFSALAGRSNIGKSAVIRAIKAALTGSPVEGYVRHGPGCPRVIRGAKSCKCFCSVHIVAEGLDLLWEKGDAVNRYAYNGTEYTVVGRGTPEFLMEGFAPVQMGDEKDILQVSDQFKPIFILNKSGTVAADILSDVAKLDEINVATRMADKDRREAQATRKVREKDIVDLRAALAGYEGLDDTVALVEKLEELDRESEATHAKAQKLERFLVSVLSVGERIKSLKAVNQIVPPDIAPVVESGETYAAVKRLVAELEDRMASVASLDGLNEIEVPAFEAFLSSEAAYEKLIGWAAKVETLREFFDKFQGLEVVSLPEFESMEGVKEIFFRLDLWATRTQELALALLRVKEEFEAILREKDELADELGVCPACDQVFGSGHKLCQD